MSAEPPRYADGWHLAWVRWIRNPQRRYRAAAALQDKYHRLADEAGNIKMGATVDVYRQTLDYDTTANQIGRDTQWVKDTVRILSQDTQA